MRLITRTIVVSVLAATAAPLVASAQTASSPPPSDDQLLNTPTQPTASAPIIPDSPPTPPLPPTPPTPAIPASDGWLSGINAGFHNDLFYIANRDASWFLAPGGRLQIDTYAYAGNHITDDYTTSTGAYHRGDVKDTVLLRRARIELVGGMLGVFTFMLGGDFAQGTTPVGTDIFFNARIAPFINFQLGQFDAPFTMENRTSDKYFDFIERSIAVRAFAFPDNKELGAMLWGETPNRFFYYSFGVFNGDGQNVRNTDNNLDFIGRIFLHPFITLGGPLADLQIGGSFHYGLRGASVNYAYPAMTTLTGWAFFNTSISTSATTPVTIVPDANQLEFAAEFDLPYNRFDLRGELIYLHNETREMASLSTNAGGLSGNALRLGNIDGYGGYAQIGVWVWGDLRVNGRPGYENPATVNLNRPDPTHAPMGLQLVARFDGVDFTYNGGSRSGNTSAVASAEGRYTVLAAEFGANFWATRHVRFSLDYIENFFPNQPAMGAAIQPADNHAHGPNQNIWDFGEVVARVGLAF